LWNRSVAEAAANIRRRVALSIVAIDRTDNGYFRAEVVQEKLTAASEASHALLGTDWASARGVPDATQIAVPNCRSHVFGPKTSLVEPLFPPLGIIVAICRSSFCHRSFVHLRAL